MNIIKEFEAKDAEGKTRKFCELKCPFCHGIFTRHKRFMKSEFCSTKCKSEFTGVIKVLSCRVCNKEFKRTSSKMKNAKHDIYFCSRACKDIGQSSIKEIQPEHYNGGINNYRSNALQHYPNKCNRCGFSNLIALEVHHIDRDRTNNDLLNLEILCANCHVIEHLGCGRIPRACFASSVRRESYPRSPPNKLLEYQL